MNRIISHFLAFIAILPVVSASAEDLRAKAEVFFEQHCYDCHDPDMEKGGLDLFSLSDDLSDPETTRLWVRIHDRVRDGEMPPPKKKQPAAAEREAFLAELSEIITTEQDRFARESGRAMKRRLNRKEYENTLRDLLDLPHIELAQMLPRDGEVHGFAKVGEALDVSHVQMEAYLDAAEFALRSALDFPAEKPDAVTKRYYAREQQRLSAYAPTFLWDRYWLALDDLTINKEVSWNRKAAKTGGADDPERREMESVAIFRGAYQPFLYRFNQVSTPVEGRYRVRLKARSVLRQTDLAEHDGKPRFRPTLDPTGERVFPEPVADRLYPGKRPALHPIQPEGRKRLKFCP